MKKFKKIFSSMAALAVLTVGVTAYAATETPAKSANWKTSYTYVPNGPSNTGSTETWYVKCGDKGNTIGVKTLSNKISGATGHVNVTVTDNGYTIANVKISKQGSVNCTPHDTANHVPRAAHYKFSSYTSYSGNTFSASGDIVMREE